MGAKLRCFIIQTFLERLKLHDNHVNQNMCYSFNKSSLPTYSTIVFDLRKIFSRTEIVHNDVHIYNETKILS